MSARTRNINVTGSTINPGLFELYALNNVDGSDTVDLDTGGVIDGSDATSTIHADTNDATAEIGPAPPFTRWATSTSTPAPQATSRWRPRSTPTAWLRRLDRRRGNHRPRTTPSSRFGAFVQAQGNLNLIAGGE